MKKDKNLIKQNVYYYNSTLKILPSLGVSGYDPNLCKIVTVLEETEPFVEFPGSYNIDDVYEYLMSKDIIDKTQYPPKRLYGILEYLYSQYGLDKIITLIDCAFNDFMEHRKLTLPEKYGDYYYSDTIRCEHLCIDMLSQIGGAKIVPRTRVLHRRSRL